MTDDVDVVVTDGFTGNVVLKTLEGGLRALVEPAARRSARPRDTSARRRPECRRSFPSTHARRRDLRRGVLLGVDGVCIISHGSSSERAMLNGIRIAREMVEADVVGEISRAIRPASESDPD